MITNEQQAMLSAPLNSAYVKKPSGDFGPKGDYLEGWHVINELNRVFGFDGWSYTIALSQDSLREVTLPNNKGTQWQAAYTSICTLTIEDVIRQDVGFGSGFAKNIGDAIEGATKEAVTDSLKRAARTFGNIFGLALYDKSRVNVSSPPPPVISDAQYAEIITLLEASKADVAIFLNHYGVATVNELPADMFVRVTKALNKKIADHAKAASQ